MCTGPTADKCSVVSDSLQPHGLYYKGLKPPHALHVLTWPKIV